MLILNPSRQIRPRPLPSKSLPIHYSLVMLPLDAKRLSYRRYHYINPLNAELYPICHLVALLGAHYIFHVRGLRVNIYI